MKRVYLLRRRMLNQDKAALLASFWVWNAERTEKRLHKLFKTSRFKMTRRAGATPLAPFAFHVKIGIAKDVQERQREVSRNIYGSGKTEWFRINLFQLLTIVLILLWKQLEPFLLAAAAIAGIVHFLK